MSRTGRPSTGAYVHDPSHSRANSLGYVPTYLWTAERALGHALPPLAVVHHVNLNRKDGRHRNLVICESQAYHMLLHRRMRALIACGNANFVKCWVCGRYDDPANLTAKPSGSWEHPRCHADYEHARRHA